MKICLYVTGASRPSTAQGAARGAGIGAGVYNNYEEAFRGLKSIETIEPSPPLFGAYEDAYENWLKNLNK